MTVHPLVSFAPAVSPNFAGNIYAIFTKMQRKMVNFVIMLELNKMLHTDIIHFLKQVYIIKIR